MSVQDDERWVPEHVRERLRSLGLALPLWVMESYIRAWDWQMQVLRKVRDYCELGKA